MAAAAAAAAVPAALAAHDRIRRSTDLPLFYGKKDKDTITPYLLIDRLEKAATIATWDTDERKCTEFSLILRDQAIVWWKSLVKTNPDFNRNNWDAVKAQFLEAYEPKYTARTTCTSFQELFQKSTETVHDFFLRVTESLEKMTDAKPPQILVVRAPPAGLDAAEGLRVKKQGLDDMERYFLQQLFTAGLREDIRIKVMEAGLDNLQETLKLAREVEVIHNDRRHHKANISAINEEGQPDIPEDEAEQDKLIEAIHAHRARNGKPRDKKKKGPCWYCKGPNHMQQNCRKRMAAKAPMVNKDGTPMKSHTSAIEETKPTDQSHSEEDYYKMASCSTIHHLNY